MTDRFDIESAIRDAVSALRDQERLTGQSHLGQRAERLETVLSRLTTPTDHAGLVARLLEDAEFFEHVGGFLSTAALEREAAAALQAPVPAEVDDVEIGQVCRAVLNRSVCRTGACGSCWSCKTVALIGRLSRTNEALTREHDARLAKVRAELSAAWENAETSGEEWGIEKAQAIIDAEFPPAGQGAEGEWDQIEAEAIKLWEKDGPWPLSWERTGEHYKNIYRSRARTHPADAESGGE